MSSPNILKAGMVLTIVAMTVMGIYYKMMAANKSTLNLDLRVEELLNTKIELSESHKRILNRYASLVSNQKQALKDGDKYLEKMLTDGTWSDIDYYDDDRASWNTINHLKRVEAIAICYNSPQSKLYKDSIAIHAVDKGLQIWIKKNPICKNWWYNDIAVPKTLTTILSLVNEDLTKETMCLTLAYLETRPLRKISPEISTHVYYPIIIRGCLLGSDSVIQKAVDAFFSSLSTDRPENIQPDMSFFTHGPQFQNGSYGGEFIERNVDMAWVLKGSKYEVSQDKIAILSQFFREGYVPLFRGPYLDYSSVGRAISRTGYLNRSNNFEYIERLIDLDKNNEDFYKHFKDSLCNEPTGRTSNTFYKSGGFILHRRPEYDFSVRCTSESLRHTESINGENLYGTYLADGAVNIRIKGDEYYNIFPVWEWDHIPGTTTPSGEVQNHHNSSDFGKNDKLGGVSDGTYGVIGYRMSDYSITCQKAWFMFDDAIVCLGSGIGGSGNVNTTVNQCVLKGDLVVQDQKFEKDTLDKDNFKGWIYHGQIGYFFPYNQKIRLRAGKQNGSWNKINTSCSDKPICTDVFNLSIDHGNNPQNATYEYFIIPGLLSNENINQYDLSNIEIIVNNPNQSAVYDSKSDVLGIIFWREGELTYKGEQFAQAEPSVVMVTGYNISSNRAITISPIK